MKYTKGEMIKMLVIGGIACCLFFWLYYGFPLWICAAITGAVEIFIFIAFCFEKKSEDSYRELRRSIDDGDYHSSEEWRRKYAEFLDTKGFGSVRRGSMKADLFMRYIRPFGIVMICTGTASAVLGGLAMSVDKGAGIITLLVGAGFIIYGAFAVYPKNVRTFIKNCGDELSVINASYMEGGLLTYKRSSTDESWNDGINISERFVVVFTKKSISAIRREEISSVSQSIQRIKYFGDGIYTGTEYAYNTDIITRDGKTHRIRLGEFQSELVCETLNGFAEPPERNIRSVEKHFDM